MITSTKNQKTKNLSALIKKGKARNEKGLFVVEGIKMFEEAPPSRIKDIYVSESFFNNYADKGRITSLNYEILKDEVFNYVSDTKTPQGVMCLVDQYNYTFEEIVNVENPLLVLADDIKDPGNLGTIIRTAEGAGVNGIIISRQSVDIYNPKTIRSTMGSIYRMPFVYVEDLSHAILKLKELNITTYAAYLNNSNDYCEKNYKKGTAFVIGNESHGVSKEHIAIIDEMIKIPMFGEVESLNAAVACSILMYEAARRRRGSGPGVDK